MTRQNLPWAALSPLHWVLVLGVLLAMSSAVGLMAGYTGYSPAQVWGALAGGAANDAGYVIRDLRLPRVLIAPVVGAALGVAGIVVQTLTRNRIASPDILGLNAGAALAVVLASVVFGVGSLAGLSAAAAAGALLTGLILYGIGSAAGGMSPVHVVIAGVTLAGLFTALVEIILSLDEATLDQLLFWLAGSFTGRPVSLLAAGGWLLIVGFAAAWGIGRALDAMVTDDETAQGLGVNVTMIRAAALVAVGALTGGAVSVAGPIAFIGLLVPHVARALAGQHHRAQMVVGAFVGALFASVADIAARFVIYPREAPVGVVTGLIGAAVLVSLLRRRAV